MKFTIAPKDICKKVLAGKIPLGPLLTTASDVESYQGQLEATVKNSKDETLRIAVKIEKREELSAWEADWAAGALRFAADAIGCGTGKVGAPRTKIPSDFRALFCIYFMDQIRELNKPTDDDQTKLITGLVKHFAKKYLVTEKSIRNELKRDGWEFHGKRTGSMNLK